jgi:hypothetical protein
MIYRTYRNEKIQWKKWCWNNVIFINYFSILFSYDWCSRNVRIFYYLTNVEIKKLSFVYLVGRNLLEWVSVVDGEFDLFWRCSGMEWWGNERRLNFVDWFAFRFWCHLTHSVGRDFLVKKNIVKHKYVFKLFKFIKIVFVRMYLEVIWSEVLQLTLKHVLETVTHIHLPAIRRRNLLKKE